MSTNVLKENTYMVEAACAPGTLCRYAVYVPQREAMKMPGPDVRGWADPWARYRYGQPVVRLRAFSSKLAKDEAGMYTDAPGAPQGSYISHLLDRVVTTTGDAEMVLRTSSEFFETHTLANPLPEINAKRIGVLGQLAAEQGALWFPSPALATFMGELPKLAAQPTTQAQ